MTVGELVKALDDYDPAATIEVGLSVPDLFINTRANLSISGNDPNPGRCSIVRIAVTAPPRPLPPGEPSSPVKEINANPNS